MRAARSGVAQVFRALGDDTRLRILGLLGVREACVCELVELLGISQPAVSEHLRRLRDAGLVEDERCGVWVFYRRVPAQPAFVRAALEVVEVPADLVARLRALPPASACSRMDAAAPAAGVVAQG